MKWLTLESKMLSATAYDDSKRILYLRFRNTGHVYRYFDFPAADHQAFLSAQSRGRFFRYYIVNVRATAYLAGAVRRRTV